MSLKVWLAVAGAAAAVAGSVAWYGWQTLSKPVPLVVGTEKITFRIAKGMGAKDVAAAVRGAGVALPDWYLYGVMRWKKADRRLSIGRYVLPASSTPLDLCRALLVGKVEPVRFRIVEGTLVSQIRGDLAKVEDIEHRTDKLSDEQLCRALDIPGDSPEGWLAPETYTVKSGSTDLAILRAAAARQQRILLAEWNKRSENAEVYTPWDALTLASIVEKETARSEDRDMVAGVLTNRLRIDMKLQADPCVIYGMRDRYDGHIRKADLQEDTPWNTYVHEGLPPTPIAAPGPASIHAALNPADTDALYYVARTDGTTKFSRTLAEHNRGVKAYWQDRRQQDAARALPAKGSK